MNEKKTALLAATFSVMAGSTSLQAMPVDELSNYSKECQALNLLLPQEQRIYYYTQNEKGELPPGKPVPSKDEYQNASEDVIGFQKSSLFGTMLEDEDAKITVTYEYRGEEHKIDLNLNAGLLRFLPGAGLLLEPTGALIEPIHVVMNKGMNFSDAELKKEQNLAEQAKFLFRPIDDKESKAYTLHLKNVHGVDAAEIWKQITDQVDKKYQTDINAGEIPSLKKIIVKKDNGEEKISLQFINQNQTLMAERKSGKCPTPGYNDQITSQEFLAHENN